MAARILLCPTVKGRSELTKWFGSGNMGAYPLATHMTSAVWPYWALGFGNPVSMAPGTGILSPYPQGYFIRIEKYDNVKQCLVQDMAMDGERCSSGYQQNYVSNHPVRGNTTQQQGRADGANAVLVDGSGRWFDFPAGGRPNLAPGGWRLIGLWGAAGGSNGAWAGPDGPYGSSLMIPNSSTLEKTYTGSGCFGPNIFWGGGAVPLLGTLAK